MKKITMLILCCVCCFLFSCAITPKPPIGFTSTGLSTVYSAKHCESFALVDIKSIQEVREEFHPFTEYLMLEVEIVEDYYNMREKGIKLNIPLRLSFLKTDNKASDSEKANTNMMIRSVEAESVGLSPKEEQIDGEKVISFLNNYDRAIIYFGWAVMDSDWSVNGEIQQIKAVVTPGIYGYDDFILVGKDDSIDYFDWIKFLEGNGASPRSLSCYKSDEFLYEGITFEQFTTNIKELYVDQTTNSSEKKWS